MSPSEFQDLLQRSLTGELSEEETRRLHQEILDNPEALEAFLAERETDLDLRRLLAPGSGDDAFLRGLLNARSTERKDPEAFVRSVTQSYSKKTSRRRRIVRRGNLLPALVAAGLLAAAASLWLFLPTRTLPPKTVETETSVRPEPERPADAVPPPAPPAPEIPRAPSLEPPTPPPPPAPKPAPSRVEAPSPSPVEAPAPAPFPAPPPRPTVTAFATLEKIKGEVYVFTGTPAQKSAASEGQALAPGQGVLTEGAQSTALLAQVDARLTLGADTQVRFAQARAEIALFEGKLDVEANKEVLLTTLHAEVRVREGRLTLTGTAQSTRLEVNRGAALFTNLWDGTSMQVKAGQRAVAQDPPGVDRKRVEEAIRKGIAFLRSAPSEGIECFAIANCDDLILLTLLSAGVSENDSLVQRYLKNVLAAPLDRTYLVSLQAMALEELDRVKYQDRIAECGQFLIDNQSASGQWTYAGTPSPVSLVAETKPDVATTVQAGSDLFGRRAKAKVVRKLQIKKTRDGVAQGDNSNAQYAALGLRACFDAGITVPAETLQRAAGWWRKVQYLDSSGRAVATGEGGTGRGWCYNDGKNPVNGGPCCVGPYSSMTSGAVSSLMIYNHMLGTDWKKDVAVRTGMNWMTNYFTVARNLNMDQSFKAINGGTTPPETYHYYSLYALERVGMFSGQEKLGRHAWYAEGAKLILSKQKADGSWNEPTQSSRPTWDTCFAILFLKRATRPLEDVASTDRLNPK